MTPSAHAATLERWRIHRLRMAEKKSPAGTSRGAHHREGASKLVRSALIAAGLALILPSVFTFMGDALDREIAYEDAKIADFKERLFTEEVAQRGLPVENVRAEYEAMWAGFDLENSKPMK